MLCYYFHLSVKVDLCYKLWVHEFVPSIAIHIIIIYTNKVLTNCSILLLVIFFFGGVCKWTSISVEYVFFCVFVYLLTMVAVGEHFLLFTL